MGDIKENIFNIWKTRDDYHHLNPNIQQDRTRLEELAEKNVQLLNKIEGEIYDFTVSDGIILPKYPKYWKSKPGEVFLRCQ